MLHLAEAKLLLLHLWDIDEGPDVDGRIGAVVQGEHGLIKCVGNQAVKLNVVFFFDFARRDSPQGSDSVDLFACHMRSCFVKISTIDVNGEADEVAVLLDHVANKSRISISEAVVLKVDCDCCASSLP